MILLVRGLRCEFGRWVEEIPGTPQWPNRRTGKTTGPALHLPAASIVERTKLTRSIRERKSKWSTTTTWLRSENLKKFCVIKFDKKHTRWQVIMLDGGISAFQSPNLDLFAVYICVYRYKKYIFESLQAWFIYDIPFFDCNVRTLAVSLSLSPRTTCCFTLTSSKPVHYDR